MIIESLLDTDLYKFSQEQAVLHQFPSVNARFKFKCRNEGIKFTREQFEEIYRQIIQLCMLSFNEAELDYLSKIYFLKPDYIDFLRGFKLDKRYIDVGWYDGNLDITIHGPWLQTILFETPVLAIVNEVYFQGSSQDELLLGRKKLLDKIQQVIDLQDCNFKFSDFGTRRRLSLRWQNLVLEHLKKITRQFCRNV